jgi:hypothetical protein
MNSRGRRPATPLQRGTTRRPACRPGEPETRGRISGPSPPQQIVMHDRISPEERERQNSFERHGASCRSIDTRDNRRRLLAAESVGPRNQPGVVLESCAGFECPGATQIVPGRHDCTWRLCAGEGVLHVHDTRVDPALERRVGRVAGHRDRRDDQRVLGPRLLFLQVRALTYNLFRKSIIVLLLFSSSVNQTSP